MVQPLADAPVIVVLLTTSAPVTNKFPSVTFNPEIFSGLPPYNVPKILTSPLNVEFAVVPVTFNLSDNVRSEPVAPVPNDDALSADAWSTVSLRSPSGDVSSGTKFVPL